MSSVREFEPCTMGLLKNPILGGLFKNVQMEGAQKPRKKAYFCVRRLTRIAAQRSIWAFFNSPTIRDHGARNMKQNLLKFIGVWFVLFLSVCVPAWAGETIRINFDSDEVGKFPSRWSSFDKTTALNTYSVRMEGGKKFLHADSTKSWAQLGVEKEWALKEFPFLQWQWRAVLFPTNSNEREKSKNDSVLGVYVVFGHWPFVRAIKYIWSDTLPVGTSFASPYSKETRMIVIKTGRSQAGRWVTEKRDVLQDYRHLYGEEEKKSDSHGDRRAHGLGQHQFPCRRRLRRFPDKQIKNPISIFPRPPAGRTGWQTAHNVGTGQAKPVSKIRWIIHITA